MCINVLDKLNLKLLRSVEKPVNFLFIFAIKWAINSIQFFAGQGFEPTLMISHLTLLVDQGFNPVFIINKVSGTLSLLHT